MESIEYDKFVSKPSSMEIMTRESQSHESQPFVSVVIPVYDDVESLKRCLKALENQTYPQNRYEVIVVDNGSNGKLDLLVDTYKQVVLTAESRPGSYAARNKGIGTAKGKVIAFTDSDCIPSANWIEKAVSTMLQKPSCDILAGKVSLFFKNPERLNAVEVYEKFTAFKQKNKVEKYNHGITANLFTFKSIFEKEGSFNGNLKSGGDVEWCRRVHSRGYNLIYADDVKVAHPARSTLRQLYRKTARVAGGIFDQREEKYSILKIAKDLYDLTKHSIWLITAFILGLPFFRGFKDAREKLKYILMVDVVGIIRIFERIRLQLGGKSRR